MFTDERRALVFERIRQYDLKQFARFLTPARFAEAAARTSLKIRNTPLNLTHLVWVGINAAIERGETFAGVLTLTLSILRKWEDFRDPLLAPAPSSRSRHPNRSKHDPRGRDCTAVTEEAFASARKLMPLDFWIALILVLTEAFDTEHHRAVCFHGFRLLALDGTCIDLPHWKALGAHFGTASNGHWKGQPQARMVMLQLPLVRLPLRYELAPLSEGERTVAARLLKNLRARDLVLMDQGFWSYGLFWQIQQQQAYFAIRLYPGVKLRTVRHLGTGDRLVSWTPSCHRWCQEGLPKAITLRVLPYQIKGFRPSAIVTNVLDAQAIRREQWTGLARAGEVSQVLHGGLYHRRWEIETTFKELKVVQGLEGGLRSRTPEGISYEIAAHVVLYLLTRWLMVEAAATVSANPLELSFTEARRELDHYQPLLMTSSAKHVERVLLPQLLADIASHRVMVRPGRHYPRPRDTKILNKGKGKRRIPNKVQGAA